MSASRTSELTGEAEDAAVWDAAGVKERDQRTTPPVGRRLIPDSDHTHPARRPKTNPCEILNSGQAWRIPLEAR